MKITDELREWAHGFNGPWRRNEEMLLAIADRIDEKHERTFRNLTDALHKQEDATRELAEKSVLLPVDADGVPIRIGDVMENLREDLEPQLHHTFRVYGILYRDYGQECALTEDGYPTILYCASKCRHYHAPTVEDVLRDMQGELYEATRVRWASECTIGEYDERVKKIVAEYASKLRLAEGEDE